MDSGLFISFSAFSSFSPTTQAELLGFMKSQTEQENVLLADPHVMEESEEIPDLSVAQARKFMERVSDKVHTAIRVIAEADASGFNMNTTMAALNIENPGDLRGVWGGITKRVRSVLGDESAYLIWWKKDENGDWIGRVSQMTHRSFRKALDIH